jgi:hypothetical protein
MGGGAMPPAIPAPAQIATETARRINIRQSAQSIDIPTITPAIPSD